MNMIANLKRTVIEAFGENAHGLSEDSLKKLLVDDWREIFGQAISESFDIHPRYRDKHTGLYFDFFSDDKIHWPLYLKEQLHSIKRLRCCFILYFISTALIWIK